MVSRLDPLLLKKKAQPKVRVTHAELRRRCSSPENFSKNAVQKYLRIGQQSAKDNGHQAELLGMYSLGGRTKGSLFSLILEEDAKNLARDFLVILCEEASIHWDVEDAIGEPSRRTCK